MFRNTNTDTFWPDGATEWVESRTYIPRELTEPLREHLRASMYAGFGTGALANLLPGKLYTIMIVESPPRPLPSYVQSMLSHYANDVQDRVPHEVSRWMRLAPFEEVMRIEAVLRGILLPSHALPPRQPAIISSLKVKGQ